MSTVNQIVFTALQTVMEAVRDRLPTTLASDRLKVDGSGVTQPVSDAGGSLTVDGGVTATQGTAAAANAPWYVRLSDGSSAISVALDATVQAVRDRLPSSLGQAARTSSLSVAFSTEDAAKVPVLGQALAASSSPVVLPNAQDVVAYAGSGGRVLTTEASASTIATNTSTTATNTGTIAGAVGAHDTTLPAGIAEIGGIGQTAAPTAVTSGRAVRAWFNLIGAQMVGLLGANGSAIASSSNGVPVVAQTSSTWDVADRAARLLGALTGVNGSGVATLANPVPTQLSDGSAGYTGAKTGQLPSALGPTSPALSLSTVPAIMRTTGVVSSLATTGVQIKATPGTVYYVVWTNSTGGTVYIHWYDSSSAPSNGDSPIWYSGAIASANVGAGNQGHTTEGVPAPNTGLLMILSSTQATYTAIGSTAFKYVVYYR